MSSLSGSELAPMAENFYGYGRWDAPFWFIAPVPGGAQCGESLEMRYQIWKALGFEQVVNCAAYHRGFRFAVKSARKEAYQDGATAHFC